MASVLHRTSMSFKALQFARLVSVALGTHSIVLFPTVCRWRGCGNSPKNDNVRGLAMLISRFQGRYVGAVKIILSIEDEAQMCKREIFLSLYPFLVLMTTVVLRGILRLLFPTNCIVTPLYKVSAGPSSNPDTSHRLSPKAKTS